MEMIKNSHEEKQNQSNQYASNMNIVTLNKKTGFDSNECTVTICGDVFLNEHISDAKGIAQEYISNNKDLELLYQKLSGQYWLVIYDKISGDIALINDLFATCPCFYTVQDKTLYISDSLKKLQKIDDLSFDITEQALFNYLYFHCIPSPSTIFKDIYKLEPGKSVVFNKKMESSETLLFKPSFSNKKIDIKAKYQDCLNLIEKSVAKYSTGETGAFLSGGLDSSSVAGMLAKVSNQARTFSIGFDIPEYDETSYANLTSYHFGTKHEVLYLHPNQVAEEFVKVAQYFDEPFGNSSAMATYFCAKMAKEKGINRLLAGDGGDEIFAGNQRYAKQKKFEFYQNFPNFITGATKGILNRPSLSEFSVVKKGLSYIKQAETPLPDRLESYNFLNRLGIKEMFSHDFLSNVNAQSPIEQQRQRYEECSSTNLIDKMLYLDWKFTLADNDLVKVGKMCEMAEIDVRYPLLDKSIVDFSCTIPAELKLPGQKLRHFYKESCRGFLADKTLSKSKHGFGLPFGAWLKEHKVLKELALDALLAFKQRSILKDSLIDKVLDAHNTDHAGYYGELIWVIVVLELWLQK